MLKRLTSMNDPRLAYLRPEQILAEMGRVPLVYLPIGLLEWHGPHLPLGVDAFNAENAALRAAELTGGLVLPTLFCGTERERPPEMLAWLGLDPSAYIVGMDFPANSLPSMYASEEVFALQVREQLHLALQMGFRLAVVISGHAASNHLDTLQRLAVEFSRATSLRVVTLLPFVTNDQGVLEVGHASRIETAVMLALHPETVRLEALPQQPEPLPFANHAIVDYDTFLGYPPADHAVPAHDDPRNADADAGQAVIAAAIGQIVAAVTRELETLKNA
jgi:creatinine amidohydrolase